MRPSLSLRLSLVFLVLLSLITAGCSARKSGEREIKLAPVSQLPEHIRTAPKVVREAYQFALANPEVLEVIPCYCGCGAEHRSVKDCFVREVHPDGTVVFDDMGFG